MMRKHTRNQVIIRKYANRRLYDTSDSRYVTIDDLAQMVKNNIDFRVVDVTSGQDLTRVILIQIILDIETAGHKLLPIGVLQQLIRFYGDRMEPILRVTLNERWTHSSVTKAVLKMLWARVLTIFAAVLKLRMKTI